MPHDRAAVGMSMDAHRRLAAVARPLSDDAVPVAVLDEGKTTGPAWLRPLIRGLQLPMWSGLQAAVQMSVALLSARWLGPGDRATSYWRPPSRRCCLLVSSLGAGGASRVVLAEPGRWWTWSRYVRLAGVLTLPHLALSATLGLLLLSRLAPGDTSIYVPYSLLGDLAECSPVPGGLCTDSAGTGRRSPSTCSAPASNCS